MRVLSVVLGNVFEDFFHAAVQNLTEGVKRGCGNGLAVFHAVDCVRGNALFVNEVVFRQAFTEKCLVKRPVADHVASPIADYHALSIDYTLSLEYNVRAA